MRKILVLFILLLLPLLITSCSNTFAADIVVTLFPHYDIAKQVSGDKLKVSILTPFGSEAHDFEPSPKQVEAIKKAKLFIYTSDNFDSWVGQLANNSNAFNTFDYLTIYSTEPSTIMHYWTDPFIFMEMIEVITNKIIALDPSNENYYLTNKENYQQEIIATHNLLDDFLKNTNKKTIYFAGHNALGGLSFRYNLEIIALIDDFKPDADHTIKDIEVLVKALKSSGVNYLFIEELIDPKVAKTIKRELEKRDVNITLLELHGYHNITKNQSKEGLTYAEIFKQNYENIKRALN